MITTEDIVDAYAEMVADYTGRGWRPYLFTFLFEEIGGTPRHMQTFMRNEVERVYALLVTRLVRKPCSPSQVWKMPVFIGALDWPVPKHERKAHHRVVPNDGCHVQGVFLVCPFSRMREPLDEHIEDEQARYVRSPLFQIHAKEITVKPAYVTRYVLKSLLRGRTTADMVVVLPRSLSELQPTRRSA